MIRFVTPELESVFLTEYTSLGIFGTKLYAQYQTYGAQSGIVDFWLCYEDDRIIGAVSKMGGNVTLAAKQGGEELAAFLPAIGACSVEGTLSAMESLSLRLGGTLCASWILRRERACPLCAETPVQPADSLREVYALHCRCEDGFGQAVAYDAWLTELSHKTRHGLAEVYILKVDNEIASTAGILFRDQSRAWIAGVATEERYRGNGLGHRLVEYTAARAETQGLTPYVLAGTDALLPFYETCGFTPINRWAQLKL